ncbi:beta-ketoacyl synthase N-terminal-like domain-containing protein [Sorangium sp. So ce375]|uniref:beta-ketoacyl synthase N-terminal-like domain-containing protein n=1 Tax=Sorangium sp. So ce375 TaxID=3133306 RepID=UPI003F5B76F8
MNDLDELLTKLLWIQMQAAGFFVERKTAASELKARLRGVHGRWLEETIASLVRGGYLRFEGTSCVREESTPLERAAVFRAWDEHVRSQGQDPHRRAQIALLDATMRALPEIVLGKVPATQILFSGVSTNQAEGGHERDEVADYHNEVLADTVVAYVEERIAREPSARIRIFEIGAGTGDTSALLLRKLGPYHRNLQEYCYTDLSQASLLHAQTEYGPGNPFLTYEIFDPMAPPAEQGIDAGRYDIVVAANVLHATRDVRLAIRNAKALLRKSGVIVLNELSRNSLFLHLTFGLTEGWWLYEDEELRVPGSPVLDPAAWKRVLEMEGFRSVRYPAEAGHHLGLQIIVAEGDGVVRQQREVMPAAAQPEPPAPEGARPRAKRTKTVKVEVAAAAAAQGSAVSDELLREKSVAFLKTLIGETMKVPSHRIDPAEPFESYGIDSILVVRLSSALRKHIEDVSSTLFFECQTINALVEHFMKTARPALMAMTGLTEQADGPESVWTEVEAGEEQEEEDEAPGEPPAPPAIARFVPRSRVAPPVPARASEQPQHAASRGVALNGISGRHPQVKRTKTVKVEVAARGSAVSDELLREKSVAFLKTLIGETMKIPSHRIDPAEPFESYGIDSILVVRLSSALRKHIEDVSSTLFFECQTINALVEHFMKTARPALMAMTGLTEQADGPESVWTEVEVDEEQEEVEPPSEPPATSHLAPRSTAAPSVPAPSVPAPSVSPPSMPAPSVPARASAQPQRAEPRDVAIIGVSGRYPQAKNVAEFWRNLKEGRNCIREIPADRWDWRAYFDEQKGKFGSVYTRWGGFIEDIDKFDPLFFKISPRDAEWMDPQERLFLEVAYETLQDAGYTPRSISPARKVGVFAGVMNGNYATGPSYYSITNRVSYLFDFQGPSVSVDTACSASLTAIHLALESLNSGTCECAIAGGVNLIVDPVHYVKLSAVGMLTPGDRCRSFGEHADGFVDGEGVGAVLLKPLHKALEDGDQIYGVIKGSMINAGGKTNGYSVPNPQAQRQVVRDALVRAGVDARAVSYIEAHGTGTSLGDPIEIAGLTGAFREFTAATEFCAIGSVKSNIGHCESAAGISGLIKVLMQMKHGQLAPTLHARSLNPNIDFARTPFVVQQELAEWKRPVVEVGGVEREFPRIAGISSFGAGGANAHVVVQELVPDGAEHATQAIDERNPAVIVLSARNAERLRELAQRLAAALRDGQLSDANLADAAYTLQVGREAMDVRLALVVSSVKQLEERLHAFVQGQEGLEGVFSGSVRRDRDNLAALASDEDMAHTIETWMAKGKHAKLLDLWVNGLDVEWSKMYRGARPRRMSLPTYPFARERYWMSAPIAKRPQEGSRRRVFLEKQWEPSPIGSTRALGGKVAILASAETAELAGRLSEVLPRSEIFRIDAEGADLSEQTLREVCAVVDVAASGADEAGLSTGWIPFAQKVIERGPRDLVPILCVTRGLEAFRNERVNLAGAACVGAYRTLQSEYGHVRSRHLDVDAFLNATELARLVAGELHADSQESEVCYRDGIRFRSRLAEHAGQSEPADGGGLPEDHVLLITGGTRGLGLLCARHFVSRHGVKRLVLTGRDALPPRDAWDRASQEDSAAAEKIRAIRALEAQGVQVELLSVSLADEQALRQAIVDVKQRMGPIEGVIHCAGMSDRENPAFIRKPLDTFEQVAAPKVAGLNALYRCLEQEPLRFFVLFSSVSAAIPALGAGQIDYAMANGYMDYFAAAKAPRARVVSVQWPAWSETGMGKGGHSKPYDQTGLLTLSDAEGLALLDEILSRRMGPVVLPALVDASRWDPERLLHRAKETAAPSDALPRREAATSAPAPSSGVDEVQAWVASILAEELRLDPIKLEANVPFQEYGMDSILLQQVVTKMDRKLPGVSVEPGMLLEFPTLGRLSEHMASRYAEAFAAVFTAGAPVRAVEPPVRAAPPRHVVQAEPPAPPAPMARATARPAVQEAPPGDKVAIIGMACHFPEADDIAQFWENLRSGKDCMREVPTSRWDWRQHYAPGYVHGKSATKFGGFLSSIEEFDPAYFKIPESQAHEIDPLQRQWLEVSVEALADAGQSRERLWGKRVGVFAGARAGAFAAKFAKQLPAALVGTGQNFITAHLAHILNFRGPNMVVDAACASALTAIHLAAQSVLRGESEIALAGGVDVLLDEAAFVAMSINKILSPEGRCRTFDSRANGIGIGEGCGVVVLKSLRRAIADQDKIYGVIDGSAINNDGNTMGVTTPNPDVQRDVILAAIEDAGVHPETISYVEAHGTGTLIGDPIELKGLSQAFAPYTSRKRFCGVGSVKSNMGHLLSAAGAASLIKVLLAMTHRQLPPTLHCEQPNPRFNFEESAFYPVQALRPWTHDGQVLRAGISGFGLGGNNAHLIVSNEGIPAHLVASLTPRGERVVFNRRRYWPVDSVAVWQPPDDGDFIEFFEIAEA